MITLSGFYYNHILLDVQKVLNLKWAFSYHLWNQSSTFIKVDKSLLKNCWI